VIIHEAVQGTEEWFAARRGVPSASMAEKILSPTGIPSKQADAYMNLLLSERLTGSSQGFEGNAHTERGNLLESEAREYYGFVSGCEVREVGFCTLDDGTFGCSPDGLAGDGLVEIKCPAPHTHIGYLLDGKAPTGYLSQLQSQLYVMGAKWVDFLSYHPEMPPLLVRVEPDPAWHAKFAEELAKFTKKMAAKWVKLQEIVNA